MRIYIDGVYFQALSKSATGEGYVEFDYYESLWGINPVIIEPGDPNEQPHS